MIYSRLKIGSDCDGCIDDFWNPYITKFGTPKDDFEVTKNVQRVLKKDKKFWTTLPVLHRMDFIPTLYCTKRTSSKKYLKEWIEENNFPRSPIYQMVYQYGNKASLIKGKIDVFVDDSIDNFIQMNLSGVPCLLMDNIANRHLGPMLRINSLCRDEIEEVYYLGLEYKIFENFRMYFGN